MEPIKFSNLNHTYLTRLFKTDTILKIFQHLLLHSNINTTIDIYTHFIENKK
ncbi:hypothetical protein DFW37_04110 [Clostridioides difficile]|nr:tyrosine-type recombinase/integrase [Clostridioides difficile]EGT4666420.1 hypothetical protein [Clostridioides difficile]